MPPVKWHRHSSELVITGAPLALLRRIREAARGFAGSGGAGDGVLAARWLFLRLMGVLAFACCLDYARFGPALIGPGGLAPYPDLFGGVTAVFGPLFGFLRQPSALWFLPGTGAGALTALAWTGLVASTLLVLNIAPRGAAVVSFLVALSLINASGRLAIYQHDNLLCESLFAAAFLAPAGWRPGLDLSRPPRGPAVFFVRWLLFRLMFESGMGKLLGGDPHWHDFTAMDLHQQMTPLPTIFGYWDHFLPHAWHVAEIVFMFAAEVVAPVLALTGRRGRLVAVALWWTFQAGIQATASYGFLNLNAIALGVMLIDDHVIGLSAPPSSARGIRARAWLPATPLALATLLSICRFLPYLGIGSLDSGPTLQALTHLRVGNDYHLYSSCLTERVELRVRGSGDGGRTWRDYPYRILPNDDHSLASFTAPYFARFEATAAVAVAIQPVLGNLADGLLRGDPAIVGLFRENPFPDSPPTRISFPIYDVSFASPEEHRASGLYWRRRYLRDLAREL